MKSTKSSRKSNNIKKKSTRPYHKRQINDSELTETQINLKKHKIENYCNEMLKRHNETFSKYYFSNNPTDFPKLIHYYKYPHSNEINEKLGGINFERIERETTNNMLDALKQAKLIVNSLGKSYKQKIIDSNELTEFLSELLEISDWPKIKNVKRYELAQNLFNIAIKILIDEAPVAIKRHMVRSLEDFYDVVELPSQLGYKNDKMLIRSVFEQIKGTNDYTVTLEKQFKK